MIWLASLYLLGSTTRPPPGCGRFWPAVAFPNLTLPRDGLYDEHTGAANRQAAWGWQQVPQPVTAQFDCTATLREDFFWEPCLLRKKGSLSPLRENAETPDFILVP